MNESRDVDNLELLEEYDLLDTESEDSRSDGERGRDNNHEDDDGARPDFETIYAELKATTVEIISALGGLEEQEGGNDEHVDDSADEPIEVVYVIGDDCLRCLRDLRNLWRDGAEDPDRTIARVFADVGVLQNLIPLLLKTAGEAANERYQKIALACTDLLTSITWPIDAERELKEASARGEDTAELAHLFTLEQSMVKYKAAVLRQLSGEVGPKSSTDGRNVLTSVMRFILLPSLAKPRHHRTERDIGTISMCLHLFRNLLAIRDPVATTLSSAEQISNAGLQSELICAMSQSHILETLLMLANSAESRDFAQWNTITQECFYVVYGGESASEIADASSATTQGSWRSQQAPAGKQVGSRSSSAKNASALTSFLNAEAHEKRMAMGNTGSSRHSRFGTTFNFFTSDGDRRVARNASSLRKTVDELRVENVTKSKRKIRRRRKAREQGAPSVRPQWTPAAKEVLRGLADNLLLSNGFETLTRSILSDIRSERVKVGDLEEARVRLMILASFFLDYFLHRRTAEQHSKLNALAERDDNITATRNEKGKAREISPGADAGTEQEPSPATPSWTFALLSEWLKPWSFKMVLVRSMSAIEDKGWLELTASLQLWMSLLRLIDCLSYSDKESERDVAESLQANHFYHKETLDLCSSISRCYSTQSFEFLQTVIAFVFVMPKMLEKYSTNKEHIFVRAKRHVKKSRDQANKDGDEQHGGTEEEETAERAKVVYSERRFSFDDFQNKLCNRSLVEACVAYLGRWRDMSRPAEQLSNVVSVMHRIAIKANDVRSFYPAHIRMAFGALLKGPLVPSMEPRAPVAAKDAKKLMEFVLKRFDKLPEGEKAHWALGLKAPRKPAAEKVVKLPREIQVKSGFFERSEEIGIAVGLLTEKKMQSRVTWVLQGLEMASAQRFGLVLQIDGRPILRQLRRDRAEEDEEVDEDGEWTEEEFEFISNQLQDSVPSADAIAAFEPHELKTQDKTDDSWTVEGRTLTSDATTSPALKMFCRLLGLEADEDDDREWKWRVPQDTLPVHLLADINLIKQYMETPFELPENVESYETLTKPIIRRRGPKPVSAGALVPEDLSSDGGYTDSESDDSDGNASEVEQKQRKRAHKRREDLKGDPRKKKGFQRRKAPKPDRPLFLADDMIDSDEDEQVEALWKLQQQDQKRRSMSVSSTGDASTPPTSPLSSSAQNRPKPRLAPASQALFLGSEDEDADDDDDDNNGDETVIRRMSSSASSAMVPSKRVATLTQDSDADDDDEQLATQQQRPLKRRQVIADDEEEE